MGTKSDFKVFQTAAGDRIYRLTLEAFYEFWTFVYLIVINRKEHGKYTVLIDSGSGYGRSNQDLAEGLARAADHETSFRGLEDISHILISHAHVDHFGGLPFLRAHCGGKIGVHGLSVPIVTRYDQHVAGVSRRLLPYLQQAGLDGSEVETLIHIHQASQLTYANTGVDFTFEEAGIDLGPIKVHHVPAHCPGHALFQLDEVLLCGDHLLPGISPHQGPECLLLNSGLGHYLESLQSTKKWAGQIHLTLPGHEGEIFNISRRITEIEELHRTRFRQVMAYLETPHTVKDTAHNLFGEVHGYQGYNRLLALEEAGAHIEYLVLRGLIHIDNFSDVQAAHEPIPIYYRTTF